MDITDSLSYIFLFYVYLICIYNVYNVPWIMQVTKYMITNKIDFILPSWKL